VKPLSDMLGLEALFVLDDSWLQLHSLDYVGRIAGSLLNGSSKVSCVSVYW
jgi:hypothetical protein